MIFGLVSFLASVVYWLAARCVDVYSYWAFGFCVSGLLAFLLGCTVVGVNINFYWGSNMVTVQGYR
jgi:dienelactone hydrolase